MPSTRDDDHAGERLPNAGDRIAGKYIVDGVLKRGGMGVVLAARHAELSHPVAIKILLPELSGDASMVARFLREGRAVCALRSEHVVRVHDVGRLEGGTPYLVMEMLHGTDLDRRVRKHGPLPWQEAVGYVMQVCEALAEAHGLGIVHRDLKPSNLFLVDLPNGVATVKVLDFGISKVDGLDVPLGDAHAITTTEAVLGSPTFMAPEQLKSAKYVDSRADLWSLGLVLYFLVSGKLAFDAETLGAYLVKILQEEPIPLRSRRPDVPEELAAIIHACLEKDPARRPQTAADLLTALAPFAAFMPHVTGLYAAARATGSFAIAGVSSAGGISPSGPTPAGGIANVPTPAGMYGPSVSTPADYLLAPPVITPAGGVPVAHTPLGGIPAPPSSGRFGPMSSSGSFPVAPSSGSFGAPPVPSHPSHTDEALGPPGLGSPTTLATWASAGKRPSSGLRWAMVAFAIAATGLVTVALWPAPSPLPPSPGAPIVTTAPPAPATLSSSSTAALPAPSDPAASASSASPSTSSSARAPVPASTGTARPKSTSNKRISGPMETDL